MDKNFLQAHLTLSNNFVRKGMYLEAIKEIETAKILMGVNPNTAAKNAAAEKAAYEKAGPRGYWQAHLDIMIENSRQGRGSLYQITRCYARLGEKDQAFAWLEKGYKLRDPSLSHLKAEPDYDNLHSDPRFQVLLRRVGFTS